MAEAARLDRPADAAAQNLSLLVGTCRDPVATRNFRNTRSSELGRLNLCNHHGAIGRLVVLTLGVNASRLGASIPRLL
jgi:hypothetical protein